MKLYKLRWLIYFSLYKLNRWLGGKTKWETIGNIKIYKWEFYMMLLRKLIREHKKVCDNPISVPWRGDFEQDAIQAIFYLVRKAKIFSMKRRKILKELNKETKWHWFSSVS